FRSCIDLAEDLGRYLRIFRCTGSTNELLVEGFPKFVFTLDLSEVNTDVLRKALRLHCHSSLFWGAHGAVVPSDLRSDRPDRRAAGWYRRSAGIRSRLPRHY